MSEDQQGYYDYKKINEWTLSSSGYEVVIFEEDDIGRCIVLDGMKVAAKLIIVGNIIKVNTIEGYSVQIDANEKVVKVIKEAEI